MGSGLTFVGMPHFGKSTISNILSERTGHSVLSVDDILQEESGLTLGELHAKLGPRQYLENEQKVFGKIVDQAGDDTIIDTSGSCIYHREEMEALRRKSYIICLDAPLEKLLERAGTFEERGVVSPNGVTSWKALYDERTPMYHGDAHVVMPVMGTPESMADTVYQHVKRNGIL